MKKRIILLLFLTTFLAIFSFGIPEIQVSESSLQDTILIEMKLYKLVLDKDGHIVSFELYDNRTKKFNLVYEYIGDSFDVLDLITMEEVLPISYDYFVPDDQGYIEIRYIYPQQGEKTYKFFNDPNFHFEVEFKNLTGYITLPTISYTSGIRYKNNNFVSYIDKSPLTGTKLDATLAFHAPSNIEVYENKYLFKINGESCSLISYLGPTKKLFLKETFSSIDDGTVYSSILDLIKDLGKFGFFSNIFYGLVYFFWWLFNITGNFGWAIILFTLIVNAILFPIYGKQKKSAIEMKQLQPELDKIKKKYKNPQKQQEEMMKLYQEKGINPASGCLTSLIPLPIMIMLWQVIYYFEGSYAYNPRFFFWTDLSIGGFKANLPLLLIAIIASLINAMLMSQDSKTAWTSVIISVIFPFMLIGLPVGVFIYYAMNNIVQTFLTFIYNKIYKVKGITVRQLFGLGPKPVRR